MAENSYPTAGGGGVTDAVYERLMEPMTPDGLVGTPTAPSLAYGDNIDRLVKIAPNRAAIVRGFYYTSGPDVIDLPITANTSKFTRYDRVVLRLDRNFFTVRAVVLGGTAGADPKPPAIVQQAPPDRYWDLPLANVRVPPSAAKVAASDVTNIGYHIAQQPLTGLATARPSPASGRLYMDKDNLRLYVGTHEGSWKTVYYDSGWRIVTPATGWKASTYGLRIRRHHGWVAIALHLIRSGATIKDNVASTLYTLPEEYRPEFGHYTTVSYSLPDHVGSIKVMPSGALTLEPDYTHAKNKDGYLHGLISYPITE